MGIVKTKVIGIDINIRLTSIAIVDLRGTVLAKDGMFTADYPDVNRFVEAICERILIMAEQNGGYESIRSIGVSAPNANYKTGSIENPVNMPWKGSIPLAAMLRDRLGLAVAVGNDAHCTAVGEYVYGSAHGMRNFVIISLGHGGVGSGFYSEERSHLGFEGFAGEIGHTCIVANGRRCNCGLYGCLEAYCSDYGMVQTARELMEQSDEPSLMRSLEQLTPLSIGACCDQNDNLAWEVFRRTGRLLGIGLANYATLVNPEAIILTGEQTQVYKWLKPSVEKAFEEHVFHNMRGKVRLVVSMFDNYERDVLGASALAWTVKEYSLFL